MTKSSRRSTGASGATSSTKSPSSSPSGAARTGRRERSRYVPPKPSFFERYRAAILAMIVVLAVALVGGFVFLSATAPTYACSNIWVAPSPDPDPDSLGAPQDDIGKNHIGPGDFVRYTYCPPASGNHVNLTGLGPIAARFYGPDDQVAPQGWIHNLEHGGLVVLYSCEGGCPSPDDLAELESLVRTLPNSPICDLPPGQIGPVIARFDQMDQPFAALLWDRVLYQSVLDIDQIIEFFETEAERTNPEALCPAPSPSPTPTPSPSPSPSASPSGSPGASPSGSPGASPSGSPAVSSSPSPSGSPAVSSSPSPSAAPSASPSPAPSPS